MERWKKLAARLIGRQPEQERAARALPILAPRVLLVVYDPIVERSTGARLSRVMGWHRVERLVDGYIADLVECSGGLVHYRVVERVEVDEFPIKSDGFRYDAASYRAVMEGRMPPHQPDLADYRQILTRFDLLSRVERGEIDEFWMFGFPYGGFYESCMGGREAFWCNAPPLTWTAECPRRFVVMGFSYERGGGEMLENFGHRAESILAALFAGRQGDENLYERFTRHEARTPGRAEVGTIHFAPNSERDYDWGNPRLVHSRCDDWYDFPNFKGLVQQVNCTTWGGGDIRLHHKWWLDHLPRAEGETNGIAHNWWPYIIDPNRLPP